MPIDNPETRYDPPQLPGSSGESRISGFLALLALERLHGED
jgi:hypothetical protein